MRGALDPRICNITLDANAVDRDGGPRDGLVDRLLGLRQTGKINFVVPGSVRTEIQHPRTPHDVKTAVLPEISRCRWEGRLASTTRFAGFELCSKGTPLQASTTTMRFMFARRRKNAAVVTSSPTTGAC